jgi:hypothetical protein
MLMQTRALLKLDFRAKVIIKVFDLRLRAAGNKTK